MAMLNNQMVTKREFPNPVFQVHHTHDHQHGRDERRGGCEGRDQLGPVQNPEKDGGAER